MKIEIKEKGTKEQYKEVVNIGMQYRALLRNPRARLSDNFKSYRNYLIMLLCLLAINIFTGIRGGFGTITIVALVIVSVAALFTAVVLIRMYTQLRGYLADERTSTVILDKKGIELDKEDTQSVRLAWDRIAFVRVFNESTCFLAEDTPGLFISVANTYKKKIFDYIKKDKIQVRIVR